MRDDRFRGERDARDRPAHQRLPWIETLQLVAPFACLNATFGLTFGVLGTGAPLVLRAHGVPLADLGLLQVIYLPIGVVFLWAPLLDRFALPWLTHRRGWIVAAQILTSVFLLVLGVNTGQSPVFLVALVFLISLTLATMDMALEALVVETIADQRRPLVTTAKLMSSSLGTMVGIVLATFWPTVVDLRTAAVVVAVLDAVMMIPILFYREAARVPLLPDPGPGPWRPARQGTWRLLGRAAIIGLYFAPALMLGSMPSLAMVDLKTALPTVGLVTGPVTTVINIAMTLASGMILLRAPSHRLVMGLALGVCASGLLFAGAMAGHLVGLAIVAAVLVPMFEAAVGVPVFNILYQWSEGDHAATDYAVLFGVAFLISFPVRLVGPPFAAAVGWPCFFVVAVAFYAVAVVVLTHAMKRTPGVRLGVA